MARGEMPSLDGVENQKGYAVRGHGNVHRDAEEHTRTFVYHDEMRTAAAKSLWETIRAGDAVARTLDMLVGDGTVGP